MNVPNMKDIRWFMSENRPQIGLYLFSIMQNLVTWRPSWIKISEWGYVHQWTTTWPYIGHIVHHQDLTTDRSLPTKSKISCTAAILDLTTMLLDVHQGPIIGHDCVQYEWNPIHSCLRKGRGQKKVHTRTDRWTDDGRTKGRTMDGHAPYPWQ